MGEGARRADAERAEPPSPIKGKVVPTDSSSPAFAVAADDDADADGDVVVAELAADDDDDDVGYDGE